MHPLCHRIGSGANLRATDGMACRYVLRSGRACVMTAGKKRAAKEVRARAPARSPLARAGREVLCPHNCALCSRCPRSERARCKVCRAVLELFNPRPPADAAQFNGAPYFRFQTDARSYLPTCQTLRRRRRTLPARFPTSTRHRLRPARRCGSAVPILRSHSADDWPRG